MSKLEIRKTNPGDLDAVMKIYADGREIMLEGNNFNQWPEGYPFREVIEEDISAGHSYVCTQDGEILAVFHLSTGDDPTYEKIEGAWLDDKPYGVIHRIARLKSEKAKGTGAFCLEWCYEKVKNIRIDTHADNIPMRKLLEKQGYKYCGTIWIETGDERMAYQRTEQ